MALDGIECTVTGAGVERVEGMEGVLEVEGVEWAGFVVDIFPRFKQIMVVAAERV